MTEQMKQALEKTVVEDTVRKKDYPISTQDASVRGALIFLSLLWNPASKKPDPGRELIILSSKGIKIYPNPSNTKMAWEFFVRISHVEKWAYSEDILPIQETSEKD